jgi:hypothetical protein
MPNVTIVMSKEGGKKGRRSNMKKNPKIALFEHVFSKNKQHIHFMVYGHLSWSTFVLHLVRGPKDLIMHF